MTIQTTCTSQWSPSPSLVPRPLPCFVACSTKSGESLGNEAASPPSLHFFIVEEKLVLEWGDLNSYIVLVQQCLDMHEVITNVLPLCRWVAGTAQSHRSRVWFSLSVHRPLQLQHSSWGHLVWESDTEMLEPKPLHAYSRETHLHQRVLNCLHIRKP